MRECDRVVFLRRAGRRVDVGSIAVCASILLALVLVAALSAWTLARGWM